MATQHEQLISTAPEVCDITTPDGFLRELFNRSQAMIENEKKAQVMVQLENADVYRWDSFSPYPPSAVPLGIYIEKSAILRSSEHDYGLVLGKRGFTNYDQATLTFEFGLISHGGKSFDESIDRMDLFDQAKDRDTKVREYLAMIVHQTRATYGSGRLRTERGGIEVDCWMDERIFGGNEIGRWEDGRILSEAGLEGALELQRELFKRAWR